MGNYVRLASTSVSHWPAARSRKNILCPNSSPAMVTNHRGRASVTFFKTRNRVELCRLQTWTVAALNGCVSSATSHPNGNKINSLLTASVGITIQKERSRTGLLQRREESWILRVLLLHFCGEDWVLEADPGGEGFSFQSRNVSWQKLHVLWLYRRVNFIVAAR